MENWVSGLNTFDECEIICSNKKKSFCWGFWDKCQTTSCWYSASHRQLGIRKKFFITKGKIWWNFHPDVPNICSRTLIVLGCLRISRHAFSTHHLWRHPTRVVRTKSEIRNVNVKIYITMQQEEGNISFEIGLHVLLKGLIEPRSQTIQQPESQ